MEANNTVKENVYHIRLINGDELLAKLSNETKNGFTFSDPRAIVMHDGMMTLQKYTPFMENSEITIQKNHVLTHNKVHMEVERFYNNSTISLNLVDKNILDGLKATNDTFEERQLIAKKIKEEKEKQDLISELKPIVLRGPSEGSFMVPGRFVKNRPN